MRTKILWYFNKSKDNFLNKIYTHFSGELNYILNNFLVHQMSNHLVNKKKKELMGEVEGNGVRNWEPGICSI